MANRKALALGLAAAACAAGGGLWYWQRSQKAQAPETPSAPAAPAAAAAASAPAAPPPDLTHSDDALRSRAQGLCASPECARWLKTEDIVRRLVAAVDCIADGTSPSESLSFLTPRKKFKAKKVKGRLYLDPGSYARYDLVAGAIDSLDPQAVARLIQDLSPYLQAATKELGSPARDFQGNLVRAIKELLKTPVVERGIPLREKVVSYAIEPMPDVQLEDLSAAQKHLLRMGPQNTVKVQNKLRQLAAALGVPADQLPAPRRYASP